MSVFASNQPPTWGYFEKLPVGFDESFISMFMVILCTQMPHSRKK
jgi:hypothetical protein